MPDFIDISIIIPLYNEEENVAILHRSISEVLDQLDYSFEVIYIDDGSSDKTVEILRSLKKKDDRIKIIKFRKNYGQSPAMAAGFNAARGNFIVTMDGDLQNDPKDIAKLIQKLNEGYDLVSGWRKNRKDKLILRKVPSKIANKIICSVTHIKLHDTGCALKIYRAEIAKRINLYGELHRFLPALAKIEGARIAEVPVSHHPRRFGKSKYNLTRTFKVIMDLLTLNLFLKYLMRPGRFFGLISMGFVTLSFLIVLWISIILLRGNQTIFEINNLFTLLFIFLTSSFQSIFLGLIAELILKTSNKKRNYSLNFIRK